MAAAAPPVDPWDPLGLGAAFRSSPLGRGLNDLFGMGANTSTNSRPQQQQQQSRSGPQPQTQAPRPPQQFQGPPTSANGGASYYPQQFYGRPQGGPPPPTNGRFYANLPQQPPPYPYNPAPAARPEPQAQRTNTVRNHVNLKKQTLKLVPVKEEPGKFTVEFKFDAAAPCAVSVFFLTAEDASQGCKLTAVKDDPPARVKRSQGLGQTYVWEELFDPKRYSADDLVQAGGKDGETYPLVVRLECITGAAPDGTERTFPEPAGCPLPQWVQSQTTYATLQPVESGWAVRVLKQKIWVDGVCYELQEIYGIEHCATGNPEEDVTAGKECVVCLSEPRDTTVLPCRHMCMCSGCARQLRHQTNRCPICRTPVESLLEIKVDKRERAPAPPSVPAKAPYAAGAAAAAAAAGATK